jgi:putative AdoMet-dependent methyltransferase
MKVREMDIEFCRGYFNTLESRRDLGWRYNEWKPCGVNYNSVLCASSYDVHHGKFRDYRSESDQIVALLDLRADQTVIDMGCGTGAFAIHAAGRCRKIYAVDVSKAMLRCARRKAKKAKLDNIEFHHGGFLTYDHSASPVDMIVSTVVLHHLPDFWKLVGLKRLAQMCKPGGRLYLFDVVFSFSVDDYKSRIDRWVKFTAEKVGPTFAEEAKTHVREEYSTFGWIMEGLLKRAGFAIETADYKNDFMVAYLCTRTDQ